MRKTGMAMTRWMRLSIVSQTDGEFSFPLVISSLFVRVTIHHTRTSADLVVVEFYWALVSDGWLAFPSQFRRALAMPVTPHQGVALWAPVCLTAGLTGSSEA